LNISEQMITTPFNLDTTNSVLRYTRGSATGIISSSTIIQENIIFTKENNSFQIIPFETGVYAPQGENNITITLPLLDPNKPSQLMVYNRNSIITEINRQLKAQTTPDSVLETFTNTIDNKTYCRFRITINKVYTAKDYNLVFYDRISFVTCYVGVSSVRNTTWDTTMGWILGFRLYTVYDLNNFTTSSSTIATVVGDTGVSTNLYNYFLICLDDYNQNHLNDGLVTITGKETSVPLPSYASRASYTCNPVSGQPTYNFTAPIAGYNRLTRSQLYSLSQVNNAQYTTSDGTTRSVAASSYGSGPFVQDVFGIIPAKTTGLANGSVYVEFGGTLQNQERLYFGPVNISRMKVQLVSDRGDVIDLNGANWSFSLICEQLYINKVTP